MIFMFMGINLISLGRILIFEILWLRLKSLRIFMEQEIIFQDNCNPKIYTKKDYTVFIIGLTPDIILPCLPAVFAELINSEVDKIKTLLARQLSVTIDTSVRNKLIDGLKFLEFCPFTFTVWRIFPVNLKMVMATINLYTTFLIVIIQFKYML
ncbi:uncharacterized protein [Epargyreus clarus]|uniref:uncharacterized protein n=1 Tax=Epargyreus clarus TaxID=520877 RepID=UPI003C30E954